MDSDTTRGATSGLKTVGEAAELLSLSRHTLRSWIASHRLEHVRLGRSVRVPMREIDRLINEGTVPARSERVSAPLSPLDAA